MSDEPQPTISVRVDHFNALMDAADDGFVRLVQKRDELTELLTRMDHYPNRDSSTMVAGDSYSNATLDDDIDLTRDEVEWLLRAVQGRIARLADALNARLQEPRYK